MGAGCEFEGGAHPLVWSGTRLHGMVALHPRASRDAKTMVRLC